jgi:Tfp pilus assembly protein PilF
VDAALEALNAGDDAAAQKALEDALRADPSIERAQKLLKVLTGR